MNQGKDKDAQTVYAALEKSANTEVAAEHFIKAFYQNKGKAFKSSMKRFLNSPIIMLQKNFGAQKLWC